MSFSDFVGYVNGLKGNEIQTVGGNAWFQVEVNDKCFIYTPSSSGSIRTQQKNDTERIFDQYLETKSLKTNHYKTMSASYLLALIGSYFSTNKEEVGPSITAPDKVEEGIEKERVYFLKKRNKKLADDQKRLDGYKCQACLFKLKVNNCYVIDCHHQIPLYMGERDTDMKDLVSLCPTCHRIAHRRTPPYGVSEIQEIREKVT